MTAIYALYCKAACPVQGGTAPAGSKVNRILLDDPAGYAVPEGFLLVADDGTPIWEPPATAPIPVSITNFQARAVLFHMPSPSGTADRTLFQDIDDALRAQGGVAWQAWVFANDVTRDGPLVNAMGANFGLTSDQLDALFIAGAGISA